MTINVKELIKNLQYYPRDLEVRTATKDDSKEINVCDINRETDAKKDVLVIG